METGNGGTAVIGAGPAGLAAAWELSRAGRRVTLLESRTEPGGRMRTESLDGSSADVGVQLLSSTYVRLLEMAESLEAADRIVRAPGRDALWRNGEAHAITYGSVSSMITSSALPAGLKLRLAAKYLPFLAAEARGLDANDPAGTGGLSHDGESIAEFGRRRLGDEFVELLAYPLLAAYYGGPPEDTSAAVYHALARVGMDVRVLAVRGGMGALSQDLLDALIREGVEFRGGVDVTRVARDDAGVAVTAGGEELRFESAVIAVPPGSARRLLEPAGAAGEWLSGVVTAPTATLALLLDRRTRVSWFGLSFPRTQPPGDVLVALCVESNKAQELAAADREVVVAFPAPTISAELAGAESGEVVERLLPGIERVFPGVRDRILRARVNRFPEGYTLFRPGYLRHLRAYDPASLPRGIALAGDYLVAPTVEGAVRSGLRAARFLLRGSTAADRG